MSENHVFNAVSEDINERWYKPVNRIGQLTLSVAMILSFLPFLYIVIRYQVMPPAGAFAIGIMNIASAFMAAWIVEPISYFPALGTAGSYMGILAGSIGQMRVPAAIIAKEVAGVQENTQEAEIIATCGIAGSVFMNCIITTLTALVGVVVIAMLPKVVLSTMSAYILPAIFGAVLAMFTTKGKTGLTALVLIFALAANYFGGYLGGLAKASPDVVSLKKMAFFFNMFVMPMCVVAGIAIARIGYKQGWAK